MWAILLKNYAVKTYKISAYTYTNYIIKLKFHKTALTRCSRLKIHYYIIIILNNILKNTYFGFKDIKYYL